MQRTGNFHVQRRGKKRKMQIPGPGPVKRGMPNSNVCRKPIPCGHVEIDTPSLLVANSLSVCLTKETECKPVFSQSPDSFIQEYLTY